MVGISIQSMALVYVRGCKPSPTRPIIQPGFLSYRQLLLRRKQRSQVNAILNLVGQTQPD